MGQSCGCILSLCSTSILSPLPLHLPPSPLPLPKIKHAPVYLLINARAPSDHTPFTAGHTHLCRAYYFGGKTPKSEPGLYGSIISALFRHYTSDVRWQQQLAGSPPCVPLIINSCGWLTGEVICGLQATVFFFFFFLFFFVFFCT